MTTESSARAGFTIIELLVAMALFSILVTIGVGGAVSALRTQRQAAAMLSTNSAMSTVMEQMVREFRTGYDFCDPPKGNNCPGGQPNVAFTNASGEHVRYCYVSGTSGYLTRGTDPSNAPGCNNAAMTALTPSSTNMTRVAFTVFGNNVGDGAVPRVVISISGQPNDPSLTGVATNMETLVSTRFNLGNN